ncbi:hypothetical protein V8C86DRAFT_2587819 [Haematococcus lacustris]
MPIVILSPAKSLNEAPAMRPDLPEASEPMFPDDTATLVKQLSGLDAQQLRALLKDVSASIAGLNQQRYAHFYSQPALPCALAFDGPAYKALEASSLDAAGLHWAQDNLRILSGLYGLLRPLDAIRPYRLDMGTKLATPRGPSLYAFWSNKVVATINQELQQQQQHQGRPSFVVNVASQEYWKAVSSADTALAAPVYTCSFPGPAVYAKQARGAMARFLITTQADSPQQLRQFTGNHGEWQWDDSTSSEFVLVFVRNVKAAKASKAGQKAAKACTGADTKPGVGMQQTTSLEAPDEQRAGDTISTSAAGVEADGAQHTNRLKRAAIQQPAAVDKSKGRRVSKQKVQPR